MEVVSVQSRGLYPTATQLNREVKTWCVKDSDATVAAVARKFWAGIDSPVSLSLEIMWRHGMYEEVLLKEVDPLLYEDAEKFADDYQAVSLLRKYPFKGTSLKPTETALKSFWDCESMCALTNARVRKDLCLGKSLGTLDAVIHGATHFISRVLGEFSVEEMVRLAKFGPGATMTHGGEQVSVYNKLTGLHSATAELAGLASALICEIPGLQSSAPLSGVVTVKGNKLSFVPKSAKTDRCIAVEPSFNVYLQLGVGRHMARRLQRAGLDLRNQQEKNQALARRGSIRADVVTIDLSSASDTISTEVVKLLLPPRWFYALDLLRSKCIELPDGSTHIVEKFSSMGNGFTFPLQTLIFWSLVRGCADAVSERKPEAVFGDDIICGPRTATLLREALKYLGFKLNPSKSFFEGNFRESCGKDYYLGIDVRPYFIKEGLQDARSIYALANGICRLALRRGHGFSRDRRLLDSYRYCVSCLPTAARRIYIPDGKGDSSGLVASFDEASSGNVYPIVSRRFGWEGYTYTSVQSSQKYVKWSSAEGVKNSLLYLLDLGTDCTSWYGRPRLSEDLWAGFVTWLEPTRGRFAVRDEGVPKLSVRSFTNEWPDLGPWI